MVYIYAKFETTKYNHIRSNRAKQKTQLMKRLVLIMMPQVLAIFVLLNCNKPIKAQERIIPIAIDTVSFEIDSTINYQIMDGFGAFNTLSFWKDISYEYKIDTLVNDLGLSIMRFELGPSFKESIDSQYNIDGRVFGGPTIRNNFNDAKALFQHGVKKFVATVWSPPAWMKTLNSKGQGPTTNYGGSLREDKYNDFADYCVAYCKAFEQETGIELYALGIQNEPEFAQPFNSCKYTPDQMKEVIKVVGKKFKSERLTTKIYSPEALPQQGHVLNFLNAVKNDIEADSNTEIFAIHNYDKDGMNVGSAGANEWKKFSSVALSGPFPKKLWMTETSGHHNNWEGAMLLAANIYNAINYGNLNAWIWWAICDKKSSEVYALIIDGIPTSRYYVSKHFYRFIRPGATRIKVSSNKQDVLALAFKNSGEYKLVSVLINKGSADCMVKNPVIKGMTPQYYLTTSDINCQKQQITDAQRIIMPAKSLLTIVWK